jgi:AraC-like DNA-binding protein
MEENQQKFIIEPGQFLILPPNNVHKGFKCCETDTIFSWLHFFTEGQFFYSDTPSAATLPKMNKNKYYKKDPFNVSVPQYGAIRAENYKQMEEYMDAISQVRIDRYHRAKLFYSSAISQIEYQIIFLKIFTLLCDTNEDAPQKDFVADIYDYFTINYQKPITLSEISKQFSFHPAHIIRSVKRKFGMTPLQLLLNIRINEAKNLLRGTDQPVNHIAESVGFNDTSYFAKQFKKIVGLTPLEYRRESNTGKLHK